MKGALFLIFFCYFAAAYSQDGLSGVVLDSTSRQPLIGCNIALYNAADSLLHGAVTDLDGQFSIEKQWSAQYLESSYVGYATKRIDLSEIKAGKQINIKMRNSGLTGCGPTILAGPRHSVAVSELSNDHIEATQPTAINEALNRLPGVMMQQGTYTTNRLSIRGIGARNRFGSNGIRGYLEEIPLHSVDGSSAVEDLGTYWMDGLSVIPGHTGPSRSNGYGGAIIYEKQDNIRYKYSLLESSQTIGQAGLHIQQYRLRGTTGKYRMASTTYDISYEGLQTDGWRDHNETSRGNLFAHVEQRFADRSTLNFYLVNTNLRGEIPSSLRLDNFENSPQSAADFWQNADGNEDYRRTIAGLTYTRSAAIGTIKLTPYMTRFVSDEVRPFNRELQDNTTYGLRAQLERRLWARNDKSISLLVGYDLQRDHLDIRQISKQGESSILPIDLQLNQSTYLSTSYLSRDWTIKAGVDITALKTGSADYDPLYVSPSLEVRYQLNREWTAYARAGSGYNQPTVDLLLINPVVASHADELTVGLNYQETCGPYTVDWHGSAYRMWTDNELTTVIEDEETFVINGPASTITGLEMSGSWSKTGQYGKMTLEGSYTMLHAKVKEERETALIGKSWPAIPRHQAYLNATYTIGGLSISARATYFASMFVDTRNTLSSDAYTLLRSRLTYVCPRRLMQDRLVVQALVEVDNLTDINYASMILPTNRMPTAGGRYYYPGQPRNLLGQVKVVYYLL